MNWIKNYVRPKIARCSARSANTPENMWIKDPESGQMVFYRDLEATCLCSLAMVTITACRWMRA